MLGRRGMLGALVGAPIAAKVAAPGLIGGTGAVGPDKFVGYANAVGSNSLKSEGDWLGQRVKELTGRLAKGFSVTTADRINAMRSVTRLDPDLANSRSFSDSAKIRIQADRDLRVHHEREKGWLQHELDDLLGKSRS